MSSILFGINNEKLFKIWRVEIMFEKSEKRKDLEPERLAHAKKKIGQLGYEITFECSTRLEFIHKGSTVMFYPYTGWASGASIQDGRGLKILLNQLTKQK